MPNEFEYEEELAISEEEQKEEFLQAIFDISAALTKTVLLVLRQTRIRCIITFTIL